MAPTDLPEYLRLHAAHAPPLPFTRRAFHAGLTVVAGALVLVNLVVVERHGIGAALVVARAVADRVRFDLAGGDDEEFAGDEGEEGVVVREWPLESLDDVRMN